MLWSELILLLTTVYLSVVYASLLSYAAFPLASVL